MSLVKIFVPMEANNIPLWKLQNSEFKCFFEKYTKLKLPDELTLQKTMLRCVMKTYYVKSENK